MKLIKGIYATFLMIFSTKIFNPKKEFKNKRVAIIGAADSAFVEKNGALIDGFDIVIRINKAPHSWNPEKADYIGSKFTYLFHSFYENNFSGGGEIDWNYYDRLEIKKVINPYFSKRGLQAHLSYYKRHLNSRNTFILSRKKYLVFTSEMEGYVPTVGFLALMSILNSECAEIFITGFTFFKSPYAGDYRPALEDMEVNKRHIESQGLHNPDLELELFKKSLKISNCKKVVLDHNLKAILEGS